MAPAACPESVAVRQESRVVEGGIKVGGRFRFTGIFGDPVEHSLSPAMHNAAYAALGLERAYLPFHVTPDRLRAAIHAIRALGLLGVNLTVPHKERAARMMAHLSDEARTLGAINCVVSRDGALHGDNTDARGLESDLREAGLSLEGKVVVIIGAGGGAAAALLGCVRLGASRIALCNRTVTRARRLVSRLARYAPEGATIAAHGLDLLTGSELLAQAGLVLNATSIGLTAAEFLPLEYAATPAECLFYDLMYARELTPFLRPAANLGRPTLDGAGMLANQGILAFELFNQVQPPRSLMRSTVMAALGRS
jgi:shikimate dehydrogenase